MTTTRDRFLGGRLTVEQPSTGYRAGVDPVLLAAWVPAKTGQSVLELGCGVGVASLCLGLRVPGLVQSGVEIDADHAALARANAASNNVPLVVEVGALEAMPEALRRQSYDHVIANPPYFADGTQGKGAVARHEGTPLATWLDVGAKRLAPKGRLSMILRPDRLRDVLRGCPDSLGSLDVQPLAPRIGRDPTLVLFGAIKGGRGPLRLRAPITLHDGATHVSDASDYSPDIEAVLRDAAALVRSSD